MDDRLGSIPEDSSAYASKCWRPIAVRGLPTTRNVKILGKSNAWGVQLIGQSGLGQ